MLEGVDEARHTLARLNAHGIDVEALGERLQVEGVGLFEKSYDDLLGTIEGRRKSVVDMAQTRKVVRPG